MLCRTVQSKPQTFPSWCCGEACLGTWESGLPESSLAEMMATGCQFLYYWGGRDHPCPNFTVTLLRKLMKSYFLKSKHTWKSAFLKCDWKIPHTFGSTHQETASTSRQTVSHLGFPGGKESAGHSGNPGSIPGPGTSPGGGKGYPLHYSGLENSTVCIVHGVAKSDTTERCSGHYLQSEPK